MCSSEHVSTHVSTHLYYSQDTKLATRKWMSLISSPDTQSQPETLPGSKNEMSDQIMVSCCCCHSPPPYWQYQSPMPHVLQLAAPGKVTLGSIWPSGTHCRADPADTWFVVPRQPGGTVKHRTDGKGQARICWYNGFTQGSRWLGNEWKLLTVRCWSFHS